MTGFALRPAERADRRELLELVNAIERHDELPLVTSLDEVGEWFDSGSTDARADIRVATVDGQLVGYGRSSHRPSGERLERVFLWGGVSPSYRRNGIGTALLVWLKQRAAEQLKDCPADLPHHVFVEAYEHVADQRALHERTGFQECRWFIDMLRPLTPAVAPEPIEGIAIVPWQPEHTNAARLVSNAAFADHWGTTPRTRDMWHEETTGHGARLDLSFVAIDTNECNEGNGEVVAFSLNEVFPDDEQVTGRREGWIGTLGTLRSHRGRGLATALLRHSHQAFAAADLTHAILNVDADSPTGAGKIYAREGYEPVHRAVMSELIE